MKQISGPLSRATLVAVTASALAACGDSTGVNDPRAVSLSFAVATASAPEVSGPAATTGPMTVAGPPMTIEGANGTLTIEEIRLIVAQVELEGEDDACNGEAPQVDDCADFEAPPRFLDLPLDGSPVEAFSGMIPPGRYEELQFEIQDLEDDEDDAQFSAEIETLRQDILAEFPDWPRKATALVVGSFESNQGETSSFRVYIEAEIEVERELVPPLVVGETEGNPDLTVDLRPDIWFGRSDGSVLELQQYDYETTGQVLELELEMEQGITEIETETDG